MKVRILPRTTQPGWEVWWLDPPPPHYAEDRPGNPALRFDMANVVTLCRECHGWVHSKKNTGREWLA